MNAARDGKIQSLILQWFRRKKRSLPWRKTSNPYKIWVSEIMLQQTQVSTVIPYYERWMKHFPHVEKLARAPLDQVLKNWEGLGYYRRARNLHTAAKMIVKKYGGKIPDSKERLQELPGIGRYTAGAIASIAFGKAEPILDGNVRRVLSRLTALREPVDKTSGEKRLWGISKTLVRSTNAPGDFNQALMELGALICLPENPKCSFCPLNNLCEAHRLKRETDFPVKARRKKTESLKTVALVIWKKGRVLLQKQPLEARWGGLWLFPQWIYANGKPEKAFLEERVQKDLGIQLDRVRPTMELEHGFTKYRVRLRVYEGKTLRSPRQLSWVEPQNLKHLPLPRPHQKIAQRIQNHG